MTTPAAVAAGAAAKDKGNAAFKASDFAGAVGHYTAAMLANPRNATFPLNRAAAYLKLGKNEDAERDCATVLKLDPRSVKALFRRGQARVALQKLPEAQSDFQAALKIEPANDAVKAELKRVDEAVNAQQAKPPARTKPADVPALPAAKLPSTFKPASEVRKRRRIPIEIVEPSVSSVSHSSLSPASPSSDLLSPVSSRQLQPSSSPSLTPAPAPASLTPTKSATPTFQAAKEARANRPMGGIFRPNGQHTIFGQDSTKDAAISVSPASPASGPSTPSPAPAPTHAHSPANKPTVPPAVAAPIHVPESTKPPITFFTFTKRWEVLKTAEDRWRLLTEISPAALAALFQSSLDASLLTAMLETFRDGLQSGLARPEDVRAYLLGLARVPRFNTVVLFMGRAERALIQEVWALVHEGAEEDAVAKRAWGVR